MTVGYNQKVAGCIWKEIKDYKEILAACDQVVVLIPIFGENAAKHTAVIAFSDAANVVETPGCPEAIHSQYNCLQSAIQGSRIQGGMPGRRIRRVLASTELPAHVQFFQALNCILNSRKDLLDP